MRRPWIQRCWYLMFIMILPQSGSDWLTCANITVCTCKWSSGKKTASCVEGDLETLPRLSTEIQVLDLHGNALKSLREDSFKNVDLLNLQRLNLSSTKLRNLHPATFRELRILVELDLSQNELSELSPDAFIENGRLRLLVLNDNPLSVLIADQFPPLPHLKRIELARCKLRAIHPMAFRNLRALESIYLYQNHLSYLHRDTFNSPVLKALTLSENPWYCDCRLKEFHEWFLMSNLGNDEVTCAGPDNKTNLSWRVLKSKSMVCVPEAVTSPNIIRTETGAEIAFGCFVRGDPPPTVAWTFRSLEVLNNTVNNDIFITRHFNSFNDLSDDIINKSAQWVNVSIGNVTGDMAGEWTCRATSSVGEARAYLTLVLPRARTATARTPPNYSTLFMVAGSVVILTAVGIVAACVCWKTRRRRVPPSRSFTDQEKKLLDTSLAVSCDRTSADMGSSCGFEMLDRSMSLESEDTQRCYEPVHITIEGPPGTYPPPPAEFALPVPYGNIFISVQVSSQSENEYPDLLGGGATLPRRSRTCFLKSAYDNMGPRITAAGSSTWSLPGANVDAKVEKEPSALPAVSTEFTAL